MARAMKSAALPEVSDVVGAVLEGRGWIDEARVRRRAGEHLTTGLTRELWKYTPIKGFLEALAATSAESLATLDHADQAGLRAVPFDALGADDEALVRRMIGDRLDTERHPLADLALLRARSGWLIRASGEVTTPLEIHFPDQGVVPVFVQLDANASLTLVEHGDPGGFLAQLIHVELAPGARFEHDRVALKQDVPHYAAVTVNVERDGRYRLRQSAVGGKRRRLEVHVSLNGTGAEVDMNGAYLVEDGQHLDQHLLVEHRAGHTTSRQQFHGIGAGKGRSVFNGRIHIHPHAPQSDAALTNRNLALHADAEMNTKPELEIYTDDVRCSHGATIGQINEDALFYLTARGLPAPAARRLLAHGFVRECLGGAHAERALARFMEALG